ncbi:MAG: nucleotide exchange factor GrpE [Chloroflexi bacterium]|nr:nucleotide exchange factor GrpE [Chloroflexota bacterium]
MSRVVRVPVRVRPSTVGVDERKISRRPLVDEAARPVTEREAAVYEDERSGSGRVDHIGGTCIRPAEHEAVKPEGTPTSRATRQSDTELDDVAMWRDRALRLQAEMENFRKRQQRLAEEQIRQEREGLLSEFLGASDNLELALTAEGADLESLRKGVSVTHQAMKRLLSNAGVEKIDARGQRFDPQWHEAVGTVPHQSAGVPPETVVNVLKQGYQLNGRLLRPAQVVVAI